MFDTKTCQFTNFKKSQESPEFFRANINPCFHPITSQSSIVISYSLFILSVKENVFKVAVFYGDFNIWNSFWNYSFYKYSN
jgi:hypothetical protein